MSACTVGRMSKDGSLFTCFRDEGHGGDHLYDMAVDDLDDAYDSGVEAERARISAWLRTEAWNALRDHDDEPWEGTHEDLARLFAEAVERGGREKGGG